jgi:hypothetical protein
MVFSFQNKTHEGTVYNGFDITMEADLRDIRKDHYQAQLISENEVLIRIPAYPYTWRNDTLKYNADQECGIVKQSHAVNSNAVKLDDNRNGSLLFVLFFSEVDLTNAFSARVTEGLAQGMIEPYTHFWPNTLTFEDEDDGITTIKTWTARISWLIAVKDEQPRQAEVVKKKSVGLSKLEKAIKGMRV